MAWLFAYAWAAAVFAFFTGRRIARDADGLLEPADCLLISAFWPLAIVWALGVKSVGWRR